MQQSTQPAAAVTRVVNACVLIELPEGPVLTDPFFRAPRWLRLRERVGLTVAQLPRLEAVLGGHGVYDHWQLGPLRSYPWRDSTPAIVANRFMARAARRAGLADVEVLPWGTSRTLRGGLTITSLPGDRVAGMVTNSYLIDSDAGSVFVGTEANRLGTIRQIARQHTVDLALLPVDGTRLLGRRLVMDAPTALAAARSLAASTLIPIHYGVRGIPGLLRCPSGPDRLTSEAAGTGLAVRVVPTGVRTLVDLDRRAAAEPVIAP